MGQMIQKVAVELVLGLFLETYAHVEIGEGFAGHQALQKIHGGRRDRGLHHEIGSGKTEDGVNLLRPG
jgi:hypothetical protein